MRVLFLIDSLGAGGAEVSLAEMLPILRDKGVLPTVACFHRRQEGVQDEVLGAGFDVRFTGSPGWASRLREVRNLIRESSPDILHTTLFEADVIGRLAAVGQTCVVVTSLVNTSYDPDAVPDPGIPAWKRAGVRMVDSWTARLADHHHAISGAVKESAVQVLGIAPDRVTVILRGRDSRRLGNPSLERRRAARKQLDVPSDAKVIVNLGRQEHQKGQVHLLTAMRTLAHRHPDILLLQAGRHGGSSRAMAAMAADPELRDHVRLLGHRDDVPGLLAAADVMAFPSLYEGLGGAVLEAMALGLPIVATSIPALREVVEEGTNAILVPPGEPAPLAEALDRLFEQPELASAFGRRSRAIFEERFTLDKSVNAMVALYERLLDRSPARSDGAEGRASLHSGDYPGIAFIEKAT
jgi:glycosyltransferase involved in cell wall biosynthesis